MLVEVTLPRKRGYSEAYARRMEAALSGVSVALAEVGEDIALSFGGGVDPVMQGEVIRWLARNPPP